MELNKIYNENCLDTMARMPDGFIDLVITSPPYDNVRDYKGFSFEFEKVAEQLFRVINSGGVLVWIVNDATIDGSETGTAFRQALYFKEIGFNLHDTMIYAKYGIPQNNKRYEQAFEYMFIISKGQPRNFNPIRMPRKYIDMREPEHRQKNGDQRNGKKIKARLYEMKVIYNIWRYSVGGGNVTKDNIAFKHPAIFPEQLAADHIYTWSNEGDLIYDPFSGSGTTCKMAHIYKRNWIGSEISKEYVELSEKRMKPYLMQQNLFK